MFWPYGFFITDMNNITSVKENPEFIILIYIATCPAHIVNIQAYKIMEITNTQLKTTIYFLKALWIDNFWRTITDSDHNLPSLSPSIHTHYE